MTVPKYYGFSPRAKDRMKKAMSDFELEINRMAAKLPHDEALTATERVELARWLSRARWAGESLKKAAGRPL